MDNAAGIHPRFLPRAELAFKLVNWDHGDLLQPETAAQEKGGHSPALSIKESLCVSTPKDWAVPPAWSRGQSESSRRQWSVSFPWCHTTQQNLAEVSPHCLCYQFMGWDSQSRYLQDTLTLLRLNREKKQTEIHLRHKNCALFFLAVISMEA